MLLFLIYKCNTMYWETCLSTLIYLVVRSSRTISQHVCIWRMRISRLRHLTSRYLYKYLEVVHTDCILKNFSLVGRCTTICFETKSYLIDFSLTLRISEKCPNTAPASGPFFTNSIAHRVILFYLRPWIWNTTIIRQILRFSSGCCSHSR